VLPQEVHAGIGDLLLHQDAVAVLAHRQAW
jgi:hypothetical protein